MPPPADSLTAPHSYRTHFDKQVQLAALVIRDRSLVSVVLKAVLAGRTFAHRGVRAVRDCCCSETGTPPARMVLLCADLSKEILQTAARNGVSGGCDSDVDVSLSWLPLDLVRNLENICSKSERQEAGKESKEASDISPAALGKFGLRITTLRLSYLNYTMTEILQQLLPAGCTVPSGFEQVGHIAHVNLSSDLLPHRHLIGAVIIDCNPTVKTVVNKTESISSTFRELPMEVIAGESNLTAVVRQHGCTFRVPYDKVYWNSRLSHEHERIVEKIASMSLGCADPRPGVLPILYDVMAGVGPFVIPAAMKGLKVHANDLNPAAVEALKENTKLNGVESNVTAYCMDGRDFIRRAYAMICAPSPVECKATAQDATARSGNRRLHHFVMNLPGLAVTFLDAFRGEEWRNIPSDCDVVVHVYTFSKEMSAELATKDGILQAAQNLGVSVEEMHQMIIESFLVRDVAPAKQMVCVSFQLPHKASPEPACTAAHGSTATRKRDREDGPDAPCASK